MMELLEEGRTPAPSNPNNLLVSILETQGLQNNYNAIIRQKNDKMN